MKTLRRNKKPIHLCEMYKDGALKKFKEPEKIYENYRVMNSGAELVMLGMEAYNYIMIKSELSHINKYHIGDRVYVFVEPPEKIDALCKTADYEVHEIPVPTLNECEVILKRLTGKDGLQSKM